MVWKGLGMIVYCWLRNVVIGARKMLAEIGDIHKNWMILRRKIVGWEGMMLCFAGDSGADEDIGVC